MGDDASILWFSEVRRADVARVGGKNASLGELTGALQEAGIKVPPGFATTAGAYWSFIDANGLRETIAARLAEMAEGKLTLTETGEAIRHAILHGAWPASLADAISIAYRQLGAQAQEAGVDVAVRSSATAEDLPEASFAGQQE